MAQVMAVGAQFKVLATKGTREDMHGKLGRCKQDDGDMLRLQMQEGYSAWFPVEALERTSATVYPEGRA